MSGLSPNLTSPAARNASFEVDKRPRLDGYLTQKVETSEAGALVMLQEWWGVNLNMVSKAEMLAQNGFRVLVPDLFRGVVAKDTEHAGHLLSGLDFQGAVRDISGSIKFLRQLGHKKVGVIGFCMGGALALASASVLPNEVDAISPFYGIPDQRYFDLTQIKCPVQAHFGTKDQMKGFSDLESARELEGKMRKAGCLVSFVYWEGADHAFMNKDRPDVYNEEYCSEATQMVSEFFRESFKL